MGLRHKRWQSGRSCTPGSEAPGRAQEMAMWVVQARGREGGGVIMRAVRLYRSFINGIDKPIAERLRAEASRTFSEPSRLKPQAEIVAQLSSNSAQLMQLVAQSRAVVNTRRSSSKETRAFLDHFKKRGCRVKNAIFLRSWTPIWTGTLLVVSEMF